MNSFFFPLRISQIQNSFVDMENMFDLLREKPEIGDPPGALPIQVSQGAVEFRNVSFSYVPERPVLHDISFVVQPGKTMALVFFRYLLFVCGSRSYPKRRLLSIVGGSVRQRENDDYSAIV